MRRSAILGFAAAAVLGLASVAAAGGLRWQLGVKTSTPSWVKVAAAADKTVISWYAAYEVENRTGEARKPSVRVELHTDTKKVYGDGGDVLTLEAVAKAWDVKTVATARDLRKGIDDGATVKCVATFGAVDDHAKKLELRIYGLLDPITMVKGKEVFEVKYWCVKYERKGDEFARTEDPWKVVSSAWVTEEPKAAEAK
jgi:hypothetical protein